MGLCSLLAKATALWVAALAVLVGCVLSGAVSLTPLFRYLDQMETSRGPELKGIFPLLHAGSPWGFTHEEFPNLAGETILVTGGNTGLGYWSAYHLAAHDAKVIIACRTLDKCKKAAAKIKKKTGKVVETALLDLSSFVSIRVCALAVGADYPPLDSLVLNAGVMMPPFGKTKEGLETQMGTNHLGHFLLTKLLLPRVEAAAEAKGVATIVAVSSGAHYNSYPEGILPTADRMNNESSYDPAKAYGQSKLANVLFAQELAERMKDKNVLVNSIHPGGVDTELFRHIHEKIAKFSPWLADTILSTLKPLVWSPRDAALTQLYAAVGPALRKNRTTGKYFHPIARETTPDRHARDPALQKRLWEMTEEYIKEHWNDFQY